MATRSALARLPRVSPSRVMGSVSGRSSRWFSDGKGKVLSEEERAAENIYIQKMERERMAKLKAKLEKEKAEAEKVKSTDKKTEEAQEG